MEFRLQPVGMVKSRVRDRRQFIGRNLRSRIIITPTFEKGLDGIDSFSHIVVVFWLNRISKEERSILKVHPFRNPDLPLKGVFATRSPVRPNPIGITAVKLLRRKGNVLYVQGLDAIDGTPVLDIKPYIREPFEEGKIAMPDWLIKGREMRR